MSSEIKPNHSLSPESGEMEFTEAAEAKMRIGDKVKVLRSSGEIEEDWTLAGVNSGIARVLKENPNSRDGERLQKLIPVDELVAWQQQGYLENLQRREKYFVIGDKVKVQLDNGDVEDDWIIGGIEGQDLELITVEKENPRKPGTMLRKLILKDDLRSWQKS